MKQVEMPFQNDEDNAAEKRLKNDEQKQQLIVLMARAISTVLKPHLEDDDDPS